MILRATRSTPDWSETAAAIANTSSHRARTMPEPTCSDTAAQTKMYPKLTTVHISYERRSTRLLGWPSIQGAETPGWCDWEGELDTRNPAAWQTRPRPRGAPRPLPGNPALVDLLSKTDGICRTAPQGGFTHERVAQMLPRPGSRYSPGSVSEAEKIALSRGIYRADARIRPAELRIRGCPLRAVRPPPIAGSQVQGNVGQLGSGVTALARMVEPPADASDSPPHSVSAP